MTSKPPDRLHTRATDDIGLSTSGNASPTNSHIAPNGFPQATELPILSLGESEDHHRLEDEGANDEATVDDLRARRVARSISSISC
jgi:hypothetical protein